MAADGYKMVQVGIWARAVYGTAVDESVEPANGCGKCGGLSVSERVAGDERSRVWKRYIVADRMSSTGLR